MSSRSWLRGAVVTAPWGQGRVCLLCRFLHMPAKLHRRAHLLACLCVLRCSAASHCLLLEVMGPSDAPTTRCFAPRQCSDLLVPNAACCGGGEVVVYPLLAFVPADLPEYGTTLLIRTSNKAAMPDPSTLATAADLADPDAPDRAEPRTEAGTYQVGGQPLELCNAATCLRLHACDFPGTQSSPCI